jgi:hypothetical protein
MWCADAVADGGPSAGVEDKARAGGEGEVGGVPNVRADGAGGGGGDGGVDCG